jgi:tetratricopeptide (TPR) repeat protein
MSRAGMLHDMGLCYHRIGLEEHAAVPLRAAIDMYSAQPDDPRLSAALLNYGNALRKSSPTEAERAYKQAAHLHLARMQYMSATPAWINLSVLYSEQGRHDEAIELSERVLRVREQTPGTPAIKIASAYNVLANAYRRVRRFKDAHAALDRCVKLVPSGDVLVASAYGTRGEIYLDAGEYSKAAEWLRKASAARQKQPSPNLRTEAEDLEREIAALTHLGKHKEIVQAQHRLEQLRATLSAVPAIERDLRSQTVNTEGSVSIELPSGSRGPNSIRPDDLHSLTKSLKDLLRSHNAGEYGGDVRIPEATTLLLYGPDAEALFQLVEPVLSSHPLCIGAAVRIRQGKTHRELILSAQSLTIH